MANVSNHILPDKVLTDLHTDLLLSAIGYNRLFIIFNKTQQEQHLIIHNQQREIEIIKAKIPGDGSFSSGPSHGNMNKEPVLFQNAPNPFSEFTNIDYFIPENTTQASITVTDAAGKLVYSYTINSTGMGRVILKDQSIAQGNYYYSLYANGRLIDTKQLSVVKN